MGGTRLKSTPVCVPSVARLDGEGTTSTGCIFWLCSDAFGAQFGSTMVPTGALKVNVVVEGGRGWREGGGWRTELRGVVGGLDGWGVCGRDRRGGFRFFLLKIKSS